MILAKLSRNQSNGLVIKRLMASQAAAKRSDPESSRVPELKTTTLPNGLIVTSLDNQSPITRIGVIVKAGSRYEPPDQLGLTHTLRSLAGFTTQESTVFGITRNIEYVGGSLTASTSRDCMVYLLENDGNYTDQTIKYLSDTIMKPVFKTWQIKDNLYRQKSDLTLFRDTPQLVLSEALHSVAFRGGLRNSIYSPEFMLGKHSSQTLLDYVDRHFVSNRTTIVGTGIEHNQLIEKVNKYFSMARGDRGQTGESKYIGGQTRIDSDLDTTYVALATEGVGLKNQKEVLALSLLQTILGNGSRIEFSDCRNTRLGQAVAKTTGSPFAVSAFNINYWDSGLFGITVAASPKDINQAVKAAVTQLRESVKNISEDDLKSAKHNLKASTVISAEDPNVMIEEIGVQALTTGQVINYKDFEKTVDSVTAQDVSSLATKIVKTKGSMVSLGQLQNVPYLEDLI